MERKQLLKIGLLIVVLSIIGVGIALYADIMTSNQYPYSEERQQVVNDRVGGSIQVEDKMKDEKKLYEEGKEYLKSGLYNEAIKTFTKLKVDYPKSEWTKRGTILWGIALTERGIKNEDKKDVFQAKDKLEEIINIYDEKPYEYSDDFTHFLLSLARVSRILEGVNLEILNHLEEMLIYYDGYTKCQLYAEIGFIYYNMEKYDVALRYFENSCGPLGSLGKIKANCKLGNSEAVNTQCKDAIKYHADYELIGDIKAACTECQKKPEVVKVKSKPCCDKKVDKKCCHKNKVIYPKKHCGKIVEVDNARRHHMHAKRYFVQCGIYKHEALARERSKDINNLMELRANTKVYKYNENLWICRTEAVYSETEAEAISREIRERGMEAIPVGFKKKEIENN